MSKGDLWPPPTAPLLSRCYTQTTPPPLFSWYRSSYDSCGWHIYPSLCRRLQPQCFYEQHLWISETGIQDGNERPESWLNMGTFERDGASDWTGDCWVVAAGRSTCQSWSETGVFTSDCGLFFFFLTPSCSSHVMAIYKGYFMYHLVGCFIHAWSLHWYRQDCFVVMSYLASPTRFETRGSRFSDLYPAATLSTLCSPVMVGRASWRKGGGLRRWYVPRSKASWWMNTAFILTFKASSPPPSKSSKCQPQARLGVSRWCSDPPKNACETGFFFFFFFTWRELNWSSAGNAFSGWNRKGFYCAGPYRKQWNQDVLMGVITSHYEIKPLRKKNITFSSWEKQ